MQAIPMISAPWARWRTVLLFVLVLLAASAAQADTITVREGCTLVDAVLSANTAAPSGGCPAGSPGADTIVLTADVVLRTPFQRAADGATGLPTITSEITVLGNGYTLSRDSARGTPAFRFFHVAPEGVLVLRDISLVNGAVLGRNAGPGTHATVPGPDGEDGPRGSVGFVISGIGGTGDRGEEGLVGGPGGAGGLARGGAILNKGALTLANCTMQGNTAQGGAGGRGGNASGGGAGGEGGPPGIPIPLILFAILGPPGSGGDGGVGGRGGDGGPGGIGQGGAISNAGGTVSVESCLFAENRALGGSGGRAGSGGPGGDGGDGGFGQDDLGPGGRGGLGGLGGDGAPGGAAYGGAIHSDGGRVQVADSQMVASLARGGAGAAGGGGGAGGDGGTNSGNAFLGGAGGDGGRGGDGLGGAIYSTGEVIVRRSLLDGQAIGGDGGPGQDTGDGGDGGGILMRWTSGLEQFTGVLFDLILDSAMTDGGVGGTGGPGGDGGDAGGGVVFVAGGSLSLQRSTVWAGVASAGGGGNGGQGGLGGFSNELMRELELVRVGRGGDGFAGARGSAVGGGIAGTDGALTLLRNTLYTNIAEQGGALWSGSGVGGVYLESNTLTGNIALASGGGLYTETAVVTRSNIIALNHSETGSDDVAGAIESRGGDHIGVHVGADFVGRTPRVIDPASLRMVEDFAVGEGSSAIIALAPGSIAINAGWCTTATDQRGRYVVDGACDAGAFEYGGSVSPPIVLPAPATGSSGDSLRYALPAGVFARIIARDGVFVQSPAEVGVQPLLDRGVVHAVDFFRLSGTRDVGSLVCMGGDGDLYFLDASSSPRIAFRLQARRQGGMACAWVATTGTLVMVHREG
jgi:hypothetical protein